MTAETTQVLTTEQSEIVDLLCAELAEALAADNTALEVVGDERSALLVDYANETDHLSKAMELAGLDGLKLYCQHLSSLFTALTNSQESFCSDLVDVVSAWPMPILGYLHLLIDEECESACLHEAVEELLVYIAGEHWPSMLNDAELEALHDALLNAKIIQDDNANAAPLCIDADSSSLVISDDVRAELLQGFLAELPEQSRIFEQSVTAFARDSEVELLLPAQRVSHTIKGAANIVGIRGLANLMHLCEDLLERIEKGRVANDKIQASNFNDLLIDVADMLGSITDFLLGIGPEPTDVQAILRTLVNFDSVDSDVSSATTVPDQFEPDAFVINESKPDSGLNTAINVATEETLPAASVANTVPSTDQQDEELVATLSMSQRDAQQLLRIAGESQIANSQFMAQIEAMKTSIEQTEQYHLRIKAMAAELEALLQTQNALRSAMYRSSAGEHSKQTTEFDPLELESYSELHSFSNQLLELTADSYEAVSHIEEQIDSLSTLTYTQRQLNRDNNDLLLRTHMVSVDSIVPRLQRCVRQACRLTQKNAVLEITGEQLQIDNRVLTGVIDPLMHLLRNAVDHGIESDEGRVASDKDGTGTISVEFIQQGEVIHIHCRDDGSGLDFSAIRTKAQAQALINEDDIVDEISLSRLLFLPGFTTRDTVSQTSGRGIGLDIVQEAVKKLGGSVQVYNGDQGGCCFTLSVPASILTAHTISVRIQSKYQTNVLSVLSRGVDNIVYIDPSQIYHDDGDKVFNYNGVEIPVFHLADLANLPDSDDKTLHALLIVSRPDGSSVAVGVDKLLASQDLVIKPLNKHTYRPPGVVGAAILGDGTVSPIVDLNELPGLNMTREDYLRLQAQQDAIAAQERSKQWQLPTALIIDDSLSARQSLSQFVSELGMQVRTAKDGFEAISVLEEVRPNVILVDLEMPRMNGLEFTAHLRADADKRDIPVIMITSRSTDKHRQMAAKAGVSDYLNKPWSDESLLTSIQQQMAI